MILFSCGSDGKLYNNGCQMMRKNCGNLCNNLNKKDILGWEAIDNNGRSGKHVYEVPAPFCLNKLYR